MSKTKSVAIILVICCSILGATAQILFKMGSNYLTQNGIESILFNYWLMGGYVCYGISTLLLIIALKYGELSVLYHIISITYIWVAILSPIFFPSDYLNIQKFIGLLFIIAGVSFIGIGGKK